MPLPARLRFSGPFPPRGALLAVLLLWFILPGLVGHDPWKADDATHFGIAFAMLEDGRWWLPALAGQPLPALPPLYYWLAAACARLFGGLLPLHDAARLATGLCIALFLAGIGHCAARLFDDSHRPQAMLLAVGCLGLLVHGHDTQPWTLFLAGTAWSIAGIAEMAARPLRGALIAGLAAGLSTLAIGTLAALMLLPTILLLAPAACDGVAARRLGIAGLAAAVALATWFAWPLALSRIDAAAHAVWWPGQGLALAGWGGMVDNLTGYLKLLPWFAWPALPLALWQLWTERARLSRLATMLPLVACLAFLLVLSATEAARSLSALPLLTPIVLLATPAATRLRRGAANAFDWFGSVTFALAAALVWLGWIAMLTGWPPRIANNFAKLEPGFALAFSTPAFAVATAATLVWAWLTVAAPPHPARATVTWASGLTLTWCLISTLWLPWVDYGKSYRGLAASLKRALPAQVSCIAGRDLGGAQRASLHYFAGMLTVAQGSRGAAACDLLLTQVTGQQAEDAPAGWNKIWEGRRSGDRNEIFRLYTRG